MWEDQAAGIMEAWNNSSLGNYPLEKRLSTVHEEKEAMGEGGSIASGTAPTTPV